MVLSKILVMRHRIVNDLLYHHLGHACREVLLRGVVIIKQNLKNKT